MTRILPWIPLATIIGLSISLAILLARPPSNVVVMTIVTPPAPAPIVLPSVQPAWCNWGYTSRVDHWCR